MKKIYFITALYFISCGSLFAQNYDNNQDGTVDVADITALVTYIYSHPSDTTTDVSATMIKCDKPAWKSEPIQYFSSMWMYVLDNSLPKGLTIGDGDMIAAFMNDECRCAAVPFKSDSGTWRYNITIVAKESDPENSTVEIRYYSKAKGAYCVSKPVTFQDGGILGSSTSGYAISWK